MDCSQKSKRLAEIDKVIFDSEILILKTLASLDITYDQFRLIINNSRPENLLN